MKLTIPSEHIKPLLKQLKTSGPGQDLWMLAAKDSCILTVDNNQTRWSFGVPAEVQREGNTYVQFARFYDYVNSINELSLIIESSDSELRIVSDSVRAIIPVSNGSLFPLSRKSNPDAKISKIDRATFLNAVKAAKTCNRETGFAYTTGLYLSSTASGGFVAATDRNQYLKKRFLSEGNPFDCTLQSGAVEMAASIPGDSIEFVVQETNVRLRTKSYLCDLSIYQENMPNCHELFSKQLKDATVKAEFDANSLISALSIANAAGSDRSNFFCYLDLSPELSRLRCNGDRTDEADIKLAAMASAPIQVWINVPQLFKTLRSLHSSGSVTGAIQMRCSNPRSPVFFPLSDDAEDFYCITPLVPPMTQTA